MMDAITDPASTSHSIVWASIIIICAADAPKTLRMPISFLRCSVIYDARPKRPRQDMKMQIPENIPVIRIRVLGHIQLVDRVVQKREIEGVPRIVFGKFLEKTQRSGHLVVADF